jgi:hypothetical protein
MRKLAEDAQRTDGKPIEDTSVNKYTPELISWSYQGLIAIAVRKFEEFVDLVGPNEPRSDC